MVVSEPMKELPATISTNSEKTSSSTAPSALDEYNVVTKLWV